MGAVPCHRLPTATAALARLASSIPRSRGQAMPKMFYSSVPREELQIFWKTPRPGALGALAKDRWRVGAPGRRAASLTLCSSSEHTAQSPHPRCRPPHLRWMRPRTICVQWQLLLPRRQLDTMPRLALSPALPGARVQCTLRCCAAKLSQWACAMPTTERCLCKRLA